MRKIKLVIVAIVMCIGACYTGCTVTSKESINLVIWHYYTGAQKESFERIIAEFNNEVGVRENISVEGISKSTINALADALYASAEGKVNAEQMPDMSTVYADTAFDLDKMGKIAALDDYYSKAELDEFIPSYIEDGRLGGALKIIPFVKSTEVMMLNEQAWTEFMAADSSVSDADLATMEGLVKVAEKYYKYTDGLTPTISNDGKAFYGRDAMANYMIIGMKQLGIDMLSASLSGEPVLNLDKTSVRTLFDNFYLPYIKGYFRMDDKFSSGDISKGKTIAMQGSSSTANFFPKSVIISDKETQSITAKVLPPVYFEGEDKVAVQQGAGMIVTKASKDREAACAKFLKWINEDSRNIDLSAMTSYMPVKQSAVQNVAKIMEAVERQPGTTNKAAIKAVMPVALQTTQDFNLYTNKAIKNGTYARRILEEADSADKQGRGLLAKAKRDRKLVEAELTSGKTLEQAISAYVTDDNFDEWLGALESGMREILSKSKGK